MAYTVPTLAQAKTALAARLNDAAKTRWIDAELGVYLTEALRVWNTWTLHWRAAATLLTVQNQAFYDLSTSFATLRGMTVTNWQAVQQIQYMLLEPPTPTAWTGTDQFTLAQVSQALQRRRDLFLQLTGAVLTRTVTAYGAVATGKLDLDESVLLVHRAAWRPTATQFLRVLRRTDEWSGDHFRPTWPTAGTPVGYSTAGTPPLQVQLMPPPSLAGELDLISVTRGDQFTDPAVSALLGVPDDWAWVVIYGALADLLGGDGLQIDPMRAAYCEQRWQQGTQAAQHASVVISARISGVPVLIGSLADADTYTSTWQLLAGTPVRVLTAGQNLLATWPLANADNLSVDLEVVRNAPIPALDTDVLQVGADLYDTILDIAQATATFKEGGQQLQQAQGLLQRAASVAGVELAIQQASQPARAPLLEQTSVDTYAAPRAVDPVEVP